ncbi:hemolysin family protein [Lutibaculum baratangense]|uniref:Magnesium and cobalt efflux protein CorC n=1 Tax=Lutibaculum baratangense AMV1 TaxID=631454 RepID=V4RIF3_9HYPH|nr:hemolysin family protein [Lutibaculum baratangense]ESR25876.1 Magnesium and cobalt efflux protein CorC [Lutibaculum baratangense AMV1]
MSEESRSNTEEPSSSAAGDQSNLQHGFFARLKELFAGRTSGSLRDDLEDVLDADARQLASVLSPKERSMLRNVLSLRDLRVEDVMVPRADIDAVEADAPIGELLQEFREAGHSRMPVYREGLDDPAGMVHVKDVMGYVMNQALVTDADVASQPQLKAGGIHFEKVDFTTPLNRTGLIRQVLYVPPSMPAGDLLVKMQATRAHMAIVVDEYGGTDGLVTIEDLVEEIVGDIEDEHDEESAPMIEPTGDGGFIADARAPIEEVSALFGDELELGDLVEEVDTLAGLVFNRAGHVPVRGELVPFEGGFEFEILDADPRRIKRVRIHRRQPPEQTRPQATMRSERSDAA